MKAQQKPTIPRFFIVTALGLGLLLSVFGMTNGNKPILEPDFTKYSADLLQNQITGEKLAEWIIQGKQDFVIAGFRTHTECKEQMETTPVFKCYDVENLQDTRWIRKRFKNFNMPMIVYGSQSEDGLQAAAFLAHLGYKVRHLAGGFEGFEDRFLQPAAADGDLAETDEVQRRQLAFYRYFTGDDPLVKQPGQKWTMAMVDVEGDEIEEEEEGEEEGESEDEDEEEEEEEEEEEGC